MRPLVLTSLAALLLLSGCVRVKPMERADLARPCMQSPLSSGTLAEAHRAKVLETRAAGGLPGDAPGGGCGCTQ